MDSLSHDQVIGFPVIQDHLMHASDSEPADQFLKSNSSHSKQKKDSIVDWISKAGEKAQGLRGHVTLGPKISETMKGKLSMGTRILQAGGLESDFRQAFAVGEGEKLLKAFQCYLSTTAGPIAGMLFISDEKIAFRSDQSLKLTSPKGDLVKVPYKVLIPLINIKVAQPSEDTRKPRHKYVQIVTEDEFEFWFMGFVSCERAFRPQLRTATMARPPRHSRLLPGRRSSPFTLILVALLTVSVVLLMLLALGIFSLPVESDGPAKHGPRRSIREACVELLFHGGVTRGRSIGSVGFRLGSGGSPLRRYFNVCKSGDFKSQKECEYLIELAKPHMQKSTVVDSVTGRSKDSRVRTSAGMFLRRGQDKIIRTIEKRIANFSFIPMEHGEGLQVLHYEVGQKYEPHFDYFMDDFNTKNGGQRIATLLMYLSDVEEGGETVFPSAKFNRSSSPELSECAKKGLSVKPKMGNALLFWSMKPDASLDPSSLHGGCAVIKGNKWSATKWMRVHEYRT
ncbi:hypothetical protein ZIOFF_041400 [Zingiber officinale]|uniref:procollagen-proline 4-dioxygenase n=1 Tax=Zingiber officinale TaxID=94328 RepID=A0A8J5KYR7_ZINOF|nr:hypothetical protein ZIOFF_041400 [Zingiber officinale]